jgi:hypothetical protein
MLRKRGKTWVIISHKDGKMIGKPFKSKAAAEKRLQQINYFKAKAAGKIQ